MVPAVGWFWDSAVAATTAGAAAGALVPAVIARLPEPAPEPEPSLVPAPDESLFSRPVDRPKEPYAQVAALPGLGWRTSGASALAAGLVGGAVGWHPALLFLLYLVPVGVALAVVDWRTRYLPTRLIGPSYVVVGGLAVLASALTADWAALLTALAGGVAAYLLLVLLWLLPGGMGYGDVRLAGLLGLALGWLGVPQLALGLYTGFLVGGVAGLVLNRLRVFSARHTPFGPHLLVGALLGVVAPGQLAAAYGWIVGSVVSLVSR
jgi:leader peptidase (prepilin peptidase)/N-methyltransferase